MKLSEAIQQAANETDPFLRRERVRGVIEFMRFQLTLNANQCREVAIQSGISKEQWEELTYEADKNG